MARPFDQMPQVMNQRARQVRESVTGIVRQVARQVDREVVRSTPVDTGRARSNWVATKNSPFTGEIPPYAPGSKLGLGETANAQAATAQGGAVIGSFSAERDRSIHITNSVPYMQHLNNPPVSSKQAPPFFIQKAIQRAALAIKGTKLLAQFPLRSRS